MNQVNIKKPNRRIDKLSICVPTGNFVCRKVNENIVFVSLLSTSDHPDSVLFTLNPVGQAIWNYIDGAHTIGDIVELLSKKYNAPYHVIEKETIIFSQELLDNGILNII